MKINNILNKLHIEDRGRYENNFYIITLENSNEYAKMYTQLDEYAVNNEFPNFEKNSNNTTTKVINYFEVEDNNIIYPIFLIANFQDEESYYLKIALKDNT